VADARKGRPCIAILGINCFVVRLFFGHYLVSRWVMLLYRLKSRAPVRAGRPARLVRFQEQFVAGVPLATGGPSNRPSSTRSFPRRQRHGSLSGKQEERDRLLQI
jgi:hypothetical protein